MAAGQQCAAMALGQRKLPTMNVVTMSLPWPSRPWNATSSGRALSRYPGGR